MGEAILSGLIKKGGIDPKNITASGPREDRRQELINRYGIQVVKENLQVVSGCDVIILAVKPQKIQSVIKGLKGKIPAGAVVISIVAGVSLELLNKMLGHDAVVRAMPNTPAQFNEAISAYCVGRYAGPEAVRSAVEILSSVGQTIALDEHLLDAVTAVSGTGPAYMFLLAEALIEAAVREGIPRHAAERLVKQTVRGSGVLLAGLTDSPQHLRAQVTSPGGTTAAAVHVLEERGFRALVEDAVQAAAERSRELGRRAEELL